MKRRPEVSEASGLSACRRPPLEPLEDLVVLSFHARVLLATLGDALENLLQSFLGCLRVAERRLGSRVSLLRLQLLTEENDRQQDELEEGLGNPRHNWEGLEAFRERRLDGRGQRDKRAAAKMYAHHIVATAFVTVMPSLRLNFATPRSLPCNPSRISRWWTAMHAHPFLRPKSGGSRPGSHYRRTAEETGVGGAQVGCASHLSYPRESVYRGCAK